MDLRLRKAGGILQEWRKGGGEGEVGLRFLVLVLVFWVECCERCVGKALGVGMNEANCFQGGRERERIEV